MIEAVNLTKHYGHKTAVDNISFTVKPGTVTGFLGPNGAGKSTTMRMIMGLDKPTSGKVTVNGRPYRDLSAPLCEVGALLDAKGLHGSRNARNHLRQLAASNGIPAKRVDEVLEITGLTSVAKKRVKGFSLGMGQRLGIAAALLGDPGVLLFDEPVNGLDPEGVKWVRETCRRLAGEGRTVFISSHLMSEMAQTADQLLVIGRGRILSAGPVDDVIASATTDRVRVASPQDAQGGQGDDFQVKRQRPVVDVPQVVVNALFEVGVAAPAVYLCPAGYARFDHVFLHVTGDLAFELFDILRAFRARADYGHFAFEDVPELR